METWKDIKGFEGIYQISNMGLVKSFKSGPKAAGYYHQKTQRRLSKKISVLPIYGTEEDAYTRIHRLKPAEAMLYLPNPDNKPEVKQNKDGNKQNNRADNLNG